MKPKPELKAVDAGWVDANIPHILASKPQYIRLSRAMTELVQAIQAANAAGFRSEFSFNFSTLVMAAYIPATGFCEAAKLAP